MEFCIHSTKLDGGERICKIFEDEIRSSNVVLEDPTSFTIFSQSKMFRYVKGRFDPRDNVENAWFLIRVLRLLTLEDDQAVIRILNFTSSSSENDDDAGEDFFLVHTPAKQRNEFSSSSKSFLFRGQVYITTAATVDEFQCVLQCRNSLLPLSPSLTSYMMEKITSPLSMCLPHRVRIRVPRRLAISLSHIPELLPLCAHVPGNQLVGDALLSVKDAELVDCVIRLSRFSYAMLVGKSNTMERLVAEGLGQLIVNNDSFELEMTTNTSSSRAEVFAQGGDGDHWVTPIPLREICFAPNLAASATVVDDGIVDSDDWLKEDCVGEEDDEDDLGGTSWLELERELTAAAEEQDFDGIIHESVSKPVEFSSEEFFRILEKGF